MPSIWKHAVVAGDVFGLKVFATWYGLRQIVISSLMSILKVKVLLKVKEK